jgi:hypothetical protein
MTIDYNIVNGLEKNIERFPTEIMFHLSKEETEIWKSQIVITNREGKFIGVVYLTLKHVLLVVGLGFSKAFVKGVHVLHH